MGRRFAPCTHTLEILFDNGLHLITSGVTLLVLFDKLIKKTSHDGLDDLQGIVTAVVDKFADAIGQHYHCVGKGQVDRLLGMVSDLATCPGQHPAGRSSHEHQVWLLLGGFTVAYVCLVASTEHAQRQHRKAPDGCHPGSLNWAHVLLSNLAALGLVGGCEFLFASRIATKMVAVNAATCSTVAIGRIRQGVEALASPPSKRGHALLQPWDPGGAVLCKVGLGMGALVVAATLRNRSKHKLGSVHASKVVLFATRTAAPFLVTSGCVVVVLVMFHSAHGMRAAGQVAGRQTQRVVDATFTRLQQLMPLLPTDTQQELVATMKLYADSLQAPDVSVEQAKIDTHNAPLEQKAKLALAATCCVVLVVVVAAGVGECKLSGELGGGYLLVMGAAAVTGLSVGYLTEYLFHNTLVAREDAVDPEAIVAAALRSGGHRLRQRLQSKCTVSVQDLTKCSKQHLD